MCNLHLGRYYCTAGSGMRDSRLYALLGLGMALVLSGFVFARLSLLWPEHVVTASLLIIAVECLGFAALIVAAVRIHRR